MKKIGLVAGGVVVLVLGGAIVAPSFVDWDKYKPLIQSKVEDATGYDVTFGGRLDMAVLPFPHLVIENLGLTVPATTAHEPVQLLTLKQAEVSVALMPLLSRKIEINKVNLVEPVIRLDVAKDGSQTWMTDKLRGSKQPGAEQSAAPAGDAAKGQNISLDNLKIEKGTFVYADWRTGKETKIEGIDTTIKAESLSGPFRVDGDFTWNGRDVTVEAQSGRFEKGAESVALQATLGLPAAKSTVGFSGVIGTGAIPNVQGEASIESANLSDVLAAVGGKGNAALARALSMRGVLTATADKADMKNITMAFGDIKASGSLAVANLPAKDGPMMVQVVMASDTPIALDSFVGVKTDKAAAKDTAGKAGKPAARSFLPETFSMPVALDMVVDGKLSSVTYKGASFTNVVVKAEKKGAQISLTEQSGEMPGGGKMTSRATLAYGTTSKSDKAGIVYADPTLTFETTGSAQQPARLLSAFVPESTIKSMGNLLKDSMALSAKGTVTPGKMTVNQGSFGIGKSSVNVAGSYALDQTGKDDVSLILRGSGINIDHFIKRDEAAENNAVAPAPATGAAKPLDAAIRDVIAKLDIPVDLSVDMALDNVTMRGVTYSAMKVDGSLKNNAVDMRTASISDLDGNAMSVTGTIKDLKGLSNLDVMLEGKTRDTENMLKSFAVDTKGLPKNFGPLDLRVALIGEKPESLNFNANAKALEGEFQASGLVVNALTKPDVDKIALRVTHPNFERLVQRFVPAYRAGVTMKKDMDAYTNINLKDGGGYDLSGIKVMLGGMNLTGEVQAANVNVKGAKPSITGALQAGDVPLDELLGKSGGSSASTRTTGSGSGATGASGAPRWSRNAINTDWMHAYNMDLAVNAKTITYGHWVLDNAALGVTLKDGILTIGKMNAGVQGGTMALNGTVKSYAKERQPIALDLKADFKDVALEQLASGFSGSRTIKARGKSSLNFVLQATGLSPAAIISDLQGDGKLSGSNVVIEGFDLAALSRSLVSTTKVFDNVSGMLGAAFQGGQTAFDTIDGPFTISEGVIKFDNFTMTGQTASILNKGTVNLPLWTIDMTSTIDLATPEDAPNLNVRFQGPLDKPGNTFANSALESYIGARVNQKLQKVINEKLGSDDAVGGLINNILGGGTQPVKQAPAPTPTPTPEPAQQAAPVTESEVVPSAGEPAPAETQPVQEQPAQQQTPEEQLIRGVLEGVLGN